MEIKNIPSFDEFFTAAEESTKEALELHSGAVQILRHIHVVFQEIFTAFEVKPQASIPGLLLLSSWQTWLGSVRQASTGHLPSSMPLFRASLEAACYAYRIWEVPELSDVWINRDRDEAARKACRREFTSAVKDVAKSLDKRDFVTVGNRDWILSGYQSAIDFGGHPNRKSLLTDLVVNDDRADERVEFILGAVFSGNSFEVKRGLIASIDYGQLITLIGVCCSSELSQKIFDGLNEINLAKEKLSEVSRQI